MEEFELLKQIVIILGLSVVVVFFFHRLKLPSILGFLLTGTIAGPFGLGLIKASHEVDMLSEIGVILLLFVIGLEFSLKSLTKIKTNIFIGGSAQVILTILGVLGLTYAFMGRTWQEGLFLGFLFSLSSTAIVLKLLQEQGEMSSPHGKNVLGILIFQDLVVVPMMLFIPIIGGQGGNPITSIFELIVKTIFVVLLVILSARYVVPRILFAIAKTRIKELFLLLTVVICFATAWVTAEIGLSLALGAFMAGLIISESDYSHQATSLIIPFREIFTSIFFVSIGMLMDLKFLVNHLPFILGMTLVTVLLKSLIAGLATKMLGYSFRVATLAGLSIFQVGEFAFVLAGVGITYGLMDDTVYQYFLSISILTMAITPFFIQNFEFIGGLLNKSPLRNKLMQWEGEHSEDLTPDQVELKDHVIIVGYGLNGKNVAKACRFANIPYVIVEMNPISVRRERAAGEPIFFGDATNPYLLEHLHVYRARVAIIAISDPGATQKVILNIRGICKTVHLIVRTRFVSDIEIFEQLGANEVIPEEFETSIEIFSRLLIRYQQTEETIETIAKSIRQDNYDMLRPTANVRKYDELIQIPDMNVTCVVVQQRDNDVVGLKLSESKVRSRFNVSVVAIIRDVDFLTDITPEETVEIGDILYVMGSPEEVSNFNEVVSM